MGTVRSGFFVILGSAVGGALYLAHKISRETGKSITESFEEVPAEVERYWSEIQARAKDAVAAGREAAQAKQAEIDKALSGEDQPPPGV